MFDFSPLVRGCRHPVMIVTGNATEKLINEAGVMGARRILRKPIRLENFIGEIAATLIGRHVG